MNGVWKMNEDKQIVICKRCKKPEYWGEMRWLSGSCVCRDCYRAQCEQEEGELDVYKRQLINECCITYVERV